MIWAKFLQFRSIKFINFNFAATFFLKVFFLIFPKVFNYSLYIFLVFFCKKLFCFDFFYIEV